MKKLLLSLLFLILPISAKAQTAPQAEVGAGTISCEQYLHLSDIEKKIVFPWCQGFMSSINLSLISENKPYVLLNDSRFDTTKQQQALGGMCLRNPNSTIEEQTIVLFKEMRSEGIIGKQS